MSFYPWDGFEAINDTCRFFGLYTSLANFLKLAPTTLHTLIIENNRVTDEGFPIDILVNLTGLVRLELIKVALNKTYVRMGSLAIQELVFIECGNAETCLFEHGNGFRSLRTLHIEESIQEAALPMHIGRLTKEHILAFIKGIEAALSLPSLQRVSGNSKYLSHCMELVPSWQKAHSCGHEASAFSRVVDGPQIKIWTKF